jgi:hypothetical protein
MSSPTIQFKRGAFANLPGLQVGEPGFTTDKYDLYVGLTSDTATNKFFGSHRYWQREDGTSSLHFKLVDKDGTNSINLKAPNTLSGIGTYILPDTNTIIDGYFLKVATDGTLSWDTVGGSGGTFTNPTLSGITTISGTSFDVNVNADFSGITTFSNTTDSSSKDTGALVVEGGVGIEKNLNVGQNLYVEGTSEFVGVVTFKGGTINLGDSDGDDINIGGEFISNLVPNTDATYDIGIGTNKRWRNANFSGIGTFGSVNITEDLYDSSNSAGTAGQFLTVTATGIGWTTITGVAAGTISTATRAQTIDTTNASDNTDYYVTYVPNSTGAEGESLRVSNAITVNASSGKVTTSGGLEVNGITTSTGGLVSDSVQIGITTGKIETTSGKLSLTSATGNVEVTNRLDVIGDLDVSGNVYIGGTTVTLRGTDVFIENKDIVLGYTTTTDSNDTTANHAGVAIASTEGTPLASFTASGINTLPDTYKQMMWFRSGTLGFATDAFAFNYGVAIGTTTMANGVRLAVGSGITMSDTSISATNFYGNSSSADQVKTITASDTNATYHITFVDAHNGSATNETVYTDDGIYYNPGTNTFTTQNALFAGNVEVQGTLTGTATTATRANSVDVVGVATNQNYYITLVDSSGNSKSIGVDAELLYNPNTNTFTVGTGVGITQFSSSVSTGTSTSSVPTSSAIIDYVGTQIGNIDLTLGINADTGGPSTVATSQTLTFSGTANEVDTSVSGQTITIGLPNDVVVGTSLSSPTVKTATLQHSNGTQAATIDTSGNITASQNLTVQGNLYVSGNTTQVNTAALTVEDRTIDLGIVNGATPSANTTWDLGVLFNYYASGAAKKSAVIWEHSDSRFKFASVLSSDTDGSNADTPQLSVTTFAPIEVAELWVNNTCTGGSSQVIACSGSNLVLQNVVIDGGSF